MPVPPLTNIESEKENESENEDWTAAATSSTP